MYRGALSFDAKGFRRGKNYVFAIAIDEYSDSQISNLRNPVSDTESIINILLEKYRFFDKNDIEFLKNEKATRENIIEGFERFVKEVDPDDNLIILYAGHGGFNERKRTGFWMPHDSKKGKESTYVSFNDVSDGVESVNSLHTILIIDCCFSGTIFREVAYRGGREGKESDTSRYAITSGLKTTVLDGIHRSPFAEELIFFLDNNEENKISIIDVSGYLLKKIPESNLQKPAANYLPIKQKLGLFYFYLDSFKDEEKNWNHVKNVKSLIAYEDFLEKHPNSKYKNEALLEIDKIIERKFIDENIYLNSNKNKIKRGIRKYKAKLKTKEFRGYYVDELSKYQFQIEDKLAWEETLVEAQSSFEEYHSKYSTGKFSSRATRFIDQTKEEINKLNSPEFISEYLMVDVQLYLSDSEKSTSLESGVTPITNKIYSWYLMQVDMDDNRDLNHDMRMSNEFNSLPATSISFYDVIRFCNWLSRFSEIEEYYEVQENWKIKINNNSGFRLPNVKEWELIAQGGQSDSSYLFSGSDNPGQVAWYRENSGGKVHPVMGKEPNQLGIYDMSGNVFEWCFDVLNNSLVVSLKGGYYGSNKDQLKIINTFSSDDETITEDTQPNPIVGFRLVRTIK